MIRLAGHRRLCAAFAGALVAACTTTAVTEHPHDTAAARGDARYRELLATLAHAPTTGAPVDGIAELLPLLDPELRGSFTLVYATRSPQHDVDPMHPRVVLFSGDARLVLAFTGDPNGPDRDILEVIHYRDDARAFEIERFVLPAAARRDPALAVLAHDNGQANPRECLRCHGSDPRPIFDSYPVWPGFYGSTQDAFALDPAELAEYRKFLATKNAPGSVYRLLDFPPGSEVSPYSLDPAEDRSGDLAPNMRLGMALTELNRQRIARLLEASPRYVAYRSKVLAALLGCSPMPIGDDARGRVRATLVAEDAAKLDRAGVTDPDMRLRLRMTELNSVNNLAELDYLARVLDVSRADWSMAIETGALALYDGILSGRVIDGEHTRDFYFKEDFLFEMLRGLATTDTEVAPLFAVQPYAIHHRDGARLDLPRAIGGCSLFAERARKAGVAWPPPTPIPPPVAYRCVRCHELGGDGPPIPFDSPARLHAMFDARPELVNAIGQRTTLEVDAESRMPLDEPPLTAKDRGALLGYSAAVAATSVPAD